MSRMSSTDKCTSGSGSRSRLLAFAPPPVILLATSDRLCRSVISNAFVKVLSNPNYALNMLPKIMPKSIKAPSFIYPFATADASSANFSDKVF